jgi:CBS domain containing-hemolysin-like protein
MSGLTAEQWILWLTLMLLGFAGSALYSGMETGAYSLNRIRLHILDHEGWRSAHTLRTLLDRPTLLLSTLLIGNNLTNYLGTASLAVILQSQGLNEWESIVLNTILVTPILFIFGETLPKDLFAAHADRLMYTLYRALTISRWIFSITGFNAMINAFSHLAMKLIGGVAHASPFHPRRQVQWLVREGVGYGVVSDEQSALVDRVLGLAERTVRDEMVPWSQVLTVNEQDPAQTLWTLANRTSRSRFPVVDARGQVVGLLNLVEALVRPREQCPRAGALMEKVYWVDARTPLRRALSQLQRDHIALAVVADERGQPVGVVSIKDLVEPLTGELASW